jgi:hypothetical protein
MQKENKPRKIIPSTGGGIVYDLTMRIKLIWRLLGDKRVNPLLKLLPIGSLVYLIFPDIAPGPIDDAAILWLGAYLFVELCPPDVVQEHMNALNQVVPGEWYDPKEQEEDIVEGEYREKP